MADVTGCVFCSIIAGTEPAEIIREWADGLAFTPLNPVCDGHILVAPRLHVVDAIECPTITVETMTNAIELAADYKASNILISNGCAATQSIFHLHIHVIPRSSDDKLMLPWGTTGDPHEPHRCKGMDLLDAELAEVRRFASPMAWLWPFARDQV